MKGEVAFNDFVLEEHCERDSFQLAFSRDSATQWALPIFLDHKIHIWFIITIFLLIIGKRCKGPQKQKLQQSICRS